MIKATVNGTTTKFFGTIAEAIRWIRSYAGHIKSWQVFDANGKLYYAC